MNRRLFLKALPVAGGLLASLGAVKQREQVAGKEARKCRFFEAPIGDGINRDLVVVHGLYDAPIGVMVWDRSASQWVPADWDRLNLDTVLVRCPRVLQQDEWDVRVIA